MNITEINQAFYRKLDAKFDKLSANDKYFRLNSSKLILDNTKAQHKFQGLNITIFIIVKIGEIEMAT